MSSGRATRAVDLVEVRDSARSVGRLACHPVKSAASVHGARYRPLDGLDVRLVMVGHDRARHLACTTECLLEEGFSGCGVAMVPQQDVDYLAMLVNGAVQVPLVL